MTSITFTVPGEPYAKARPRFGRGRAYADPQTVAAEHAVRFYARRAFGAAWEPLAGPVRVVVAARFAAPPSWSRKSREAARGAPHLSRPDLDNVVKLILDALNPMYDKKQKPPKLLWCGAWVDDSRICDVVATKRYADADGTEGVTVTLENMT